jgi:hypothetical protein
VVQAADIWVMVTDSGLRRNAPNSASLMRGRDWVA